MAAFFEPEVLIVNEALSVGGAAFQEKCRQRMDALIKDGRTLLLVSHAGRLLGEVCQRCIYLEGGRVKYDGVTSEAVRRYEEASAATVAA
jgi:lipopolysaccharide transport system ATP-binding protein